MKNVLASFGGEEGEDIHFRRLGRDMAMAPRKLERGLRRHAVPRCTTMHHWIRVRASSACKPHAQNENLTFLCVSAARVQERARHTSGACPGGWSARRGATAGV